METNDLMTVEEAAAAKGVSIKTIYKAIDADRLPCVRLYRRVLIRRADVEAYQIVGHRPRIHPLRPKHSRPGRPRKEAEESV